MCIVEVFQNIFVMNVLPACMLVYHMYAGAHGGQKRASDPLELGLQIILSAMWVSEITTRFSARALTAPNCWGGRNRQPWSLLASQSSTNQSSQANEKLCFQKQIGQCLKEEHKPEGGPGMCVQTQRWGEERESCP